METIKACWPAPTWVRAMTVTRQGGYSQGVFQGMNLSFLVGDRKQHVWQNHLLLQQRLRLPKEPFWLHQVHNTTLLRLPESSSHREADGTWTKEVGQVCVVLSADCLPVLLCDTAGTLVAALHCGWRGLLAGFLEKSVRHLQPHAQGDLLAWFGPAIGSCHYEVGEALRRAFVEKGLEASIAFQAIPHSYRWKANLYQLAALRLKAVGVSALYGGHFCTYEEKQRFYSFRREKITGRIATLIWLEPH